MNEGISRVYLVNFNRYRYAVKADDIEKLAAPDEVLPLPSSVSGRNIYAATIGNAVYYLYDLSLTLGGGPSDFQKTSHVCIIPGADKLDGFFIIDGSEKTLMPLKRLPLPLFISSSVIDSAVIIEGAPVPMLNIRALHEGLQGTDRLQPCLPYEPGIEGKRDIRSSGSFRIYTSGSMKYAVPDFMAGDDDIEISGIAPVSYFPDDIAGIALYNDAIISVMYVFGGTDSTVINEGILTAPTDTGEILGFITGEMPGNITAAENGVMELPPIARTGSCSYAIHDDDNIYPVVDLRAVPGDIMNRKGMEYYLGMYAPGSEFPTRFFNGEIELMEFEFGGGIYGLPGEEVVECFSFTEYTRFPGLPSMIPGIIRYKDELLPVLDLALWSGSSTYGNRYRDMVLFANGNLRLAVAVDRVVDWKIIKAVNQREYRHLYIYGCYTDKKLKIILNIYAMIMNFNKVEFTLIDTDKTEAHPVSTEPEEREEIFGGAGSGIHNEEEAVEEIKEAVAAEPVKPNDRRETWQGAFLRKEAQVRDDGVKQDAAADRPPAGKPEPAPIKAGIKPFSGKDIPAVAETGARADNRYMTGKRRASSRDSSQPAERASLKKPVIITAFVLLLSVVLPLSYNFIFKSDTVKETVPEREKGEEVKTPDIKTGEGKEDRPAGVPETMRKFILSEDDSRIVFKNIQFPPDSDKLLPVERDRLDKIASILARFKGNRVRIAGHTAGFGTDSGRKFLSGERAGAVGRYLVSSGACDDDRLNYVSMGSAQPLADDSTQDGRRKNRRVEIILLKK